jgi:hypothetical protein
MKRKSKQLRSLPVAALILANMVPAFGVIFFGWDAFYIVLLYWAENLVVGFYNILKIAFAKVGGAANLGKLFLIPFFIIHYGGFMAVHGLFIFAIFNRTGGATEVFPRVGGQWPCVLVFVQLLVNVIWHAYSTIPDEAKAAVLALFASHGVSFVVNYLVHGEYTKTVPGKLMHQPYSRVVIMHVAILAGGFVSMLMGSPVGVLIILILVKTLIDIKLHLLEHKKTALDKHEIL